MIFTSTKAKRLQKEDTNFFKLITFFCSQSLMLLYKYPASCYTTDIMTVNTNTCLKCNIVVFSNENIMG